MNGESGADRRDRAEDEDESHRHDPGGAKSVRLGVVNEAPLSRRVDAEGDIFQSGFPPTMRMRERRRLPSSFSSSTSTSSN